MTIKNWLSSMAAGLFMERPAHKMTLAQHAAQLEKSGQEIAQRLRQVKGTDANAEALRHIIGIERWGQRRLQVALGDPFVQDDYDDYRPADDAGWEALRVEFDETRQTTLVLIRDLFDSGVDPSQTILHNMYGKLSLLAWLRYLDTHASLEAKRIR